jgi:hypothetical protein
MEECGAQSDAEQGDIACHGRGPLVGKITCGVFGRRKTPVSERRDYAVWVGRITQSAGEVVRRADFGRFSQLALYSVRRLGNKFQII